MSAHTATAPASAAEVFALPSAIPALEAVARRASRRRGHPEAAEDVRQELALAVFRHEEKFLALIVRYNGDLVRVFSAFIDRATAELRRWIRLTAKLQSLAREVEARDEGALAAAELWQVVRDGLDRLPDSERHAMRLVVLYQLPPLEIAQRLGRTSDAVYQALSRGRSRLGAYLEERGWGWSH